MSNELKSASSVKTGKKFSEKRNAIGCTIEEVSEKLFINKDYISAIEKGNYTHWISTIDYLKILSTISLTMAMAAVGISINLVELKLMGLKPFVVGLIAAIVVGIISLVYIETLLKFIV